MGFRFQRSIKLLPGIRLNLSKSGLGVSAGVKGFRVGVDSRGKKYVNAGIPGTGLSIRQYASVPSKHLTSPQETPQLEPVQGSSAPAKKTSAHPIAIIFGLCVCALIGAVLLSESGTDSSKIPLAATMPVAVAPEQKAIETATNELLRHHSEMTRDRVTPNGLEPVSRTATGFTVRLHYLSQGGSFKPFVCEVQDENASCRLASPEKKAKPTPNTSSALTPRSYGSQVYIGPRGGRYHYSRSGKKVYEHRRR
jgi:hypothetical protein